jgi:hypothetical protein
MSLVNGCVWDLGVVEEWLGSIQYRATTVTGSMELSGVCVCVG